MGQLMRRALQVLATGREIGAVIFDGETLTFEGQAAQVLGYLRRQVNDDAKFGRDLMADGWMNQAVELGPVDVRAAAGHDVTPGHDELHHWWVYGPGRERWHTWTELHAQLLEHMTPEKATLAASAWFEERYGYAAGSDLNRVKHGKPPRGDKVGPG